MLYRNTIELKYGYELLKVQGIIPEQLAYYEKTLTKRWQLSNRNFRRLFDYGVFTMSSNRNRNNQTSWINVQLSDEDKDNIRNDEPDATIILESIGTLTVSGYSFNIRTKGDNIIAMAFKTADDDESVNLGISAFSPDLELSLHVLLYKMLVALDGQWDVSLCEKQTRSGSFG